MDRIHRLGQHRPVQAIKLVIEDSIESRIVQVRDAVFEFVVITKYPLASREEVCHGQCDVIHRRVGMCLFLFCSVPLLKRVTITGHGPLDPRGCAYEFACL